ncbi:MAG: VCBS repeat-containing protein [Nitrospinota bacterium]|nr:VCBS repeat-containing protein [Nitrospinota bacterium]
MMKTIFPTKTVLRYSALACLLTLFCSACGKGQMFGEDPKLQKYKDQTHAYLADLEPGILKSQLAYVNRDSFPDLVILRAGDRGQPVIRVWNNRSGEKFELVKRAGWEGQRNDQILFMALQDLNHDGVQDLVLVGRFEDGSVAKVLFNNGKGYFYTKKEVPFPHVNRGIDRVDLRDIDGDGHIDLFFTGKRVLNDQGKLHRHQTQFMLNNGRGQFKDSTQLLMPPLKPGIVGTAFADYDGDKTLDIFLINGEGQNSLLTNNGLGQFEDRTQELLPAIQDRSAHADWADFDQDGDNDLLVVNREKFSSGETSYFLVNHGRGYFEKGPFKAAPNAIFHAVYLLDANGSELPDILLLSDKGIHYLRGLGKWRFWKESQRRLPFNDKFHELTFADVNRDTFLDIFGYAKKDGRGVLWINTFE